MRISGCPSQWQIHKILHLNAIWRVPLCKDLLTVQGVSRHRSFESHKTIWWTKSCAPILFSCIYLKNIEREREWWNSLGTSWYDVSIISFGGNLSPAPSGPYPWPLPSTCGNDPILLAKLLITLQRPWGDSLFGNYPLQWCGQKDDKNCRIFLCSLHDHIVKHSIWWLDLLGGLALPRWFALSGLVLWQWLGHTLTHPGPRVPFLARLIFNQKTKDLTYYNTLKISLKLHNPTHPL